MSLAGDYSQGGVDAADYVAWPNNLGCTTSFPNDTSPAPDRSTTSPVLVLFGRLLHWPFKHWTRIPTLGRLSDLASVIGCLFGARRRA